MAAPPAYRHPPAPFTAPTSGDIDQRLAIIAAELNKKANAGLTGPAYRFVDLIAPDGSSWRVTIDDLGALHTEQVPRL